MPFPPTLAQIEPALQDAAGALVAEASLGWRGLLSIAVVAGVLVGLIARRNTPVELLFLAGLVIVTLAGVIDAPTALAGFASGPVLLIGSLFAIAAGLRTTGALDWVGDRLLGGAKTEGAALGRLVLVAPVSAVVLNTPLVAMLAPVVLDWCRKHNVSPSRLLMPLSYLTILGGVGTTIGTSTTLVCNAILSDLQTASGDEGAYGEGVSEIGLLEIAWVGAPLAVIGVVYMLMVAPRLLPNRTDLMRKLGDKRREYLVEMLVQPQCAMIGKTIQEAGLRRLPGLFLIEIDRNGEVITPVTPRDVIQSHDRLVFTGVVETIADLERIPGLVPAVDMTYEFQPAQQTRRQLAEAVLSRSSPVIGRTVRDANFRQVYNAAIVAVHRNGERLTNKIGDVRLEPGDTLLLQTPSGFSDAHRNNRDFYLVSEVSGSSARRHDRALVAIGLFLLLIGWLIAGALVGPLLTEGTVAAAMLDRKAQPVVAIAVLMAMIGTRCLTASQARRAIDLQVLITIAAAMGLGAALKQSGAADFLAAFLVNGVASWDSLSASATPWVLLAVVYVTSMVLTEMITNVAVATIMLPLAIGVAHSAGYSPQPFIMAVAIAASLSFATPIGYQTNLMVMGPGGYQPKDYLRVGLPLSALIATAAVLLLGLLWPF
ncbi:potassium transporter peripheral membrane component [Pseudobythopirellula maris]|uniref:Potassium transporter peripheral membrane component n=1 Tax=Pseudobythopirellula maris TaxID=2527991 RepID=A0A5C5ZMU2_9BACT|nr:SLC13 family permease [Pseudobythopirellula maris]TWT88416.1 potassium transporter peripheral membrane component [Pseudobythopirellula maris]